MLNYGTSKNYRGYSEVPKGANTAVIITIDGPSGVGKSTLAALLSDNLNCLCINSGNIYRAITHELLNTYGNKLQKLLDRNRLELPKELDQFSIQLEKNCIKINSHCLENPQLHNAIIDANVAELSRIPKIRDLVTELMREQAQAGDLVAEGRDMGTVVFPEADIKFYLDADLQTRAERRFNQGSSSMNLQEISKNIEKRDYIDRNKKHGALKIDTNAYFIDTTGLTIEQVYAIMKVHLKNNLLAFE